MSLRSNLARNLRALCEKGNVNAACRAMKINRQQFEKYLTGESLPSARSLEKMCAFFGVTEADLLADEIPASRKTVSFDQRVADRVRPLWSEHSSSIKPGIYFMWLTVPFEPDQVVCAPVIIEREGEALTFRRIVGAAEPRDKIWWHRVGDHQGLVVERLGWIMFVGVNQRGTFEPSMIRVTWIPLSLPVLGGHATITTHSGISFAAACIRPAPPNTSFRAAVRKSRSYDRDDPSIDAVTKMVLDQQKRDLQDILARQFAG
ncbi:helix-turn-helix domain-containing protein [Rhizobium sp.]